MQDGSQNQAGRIVPGAKTRTRNPNVGRPHPSAARGRGERDAIYHRSCNFQKREYGQRGRCPRRAYYVKPFTRMSTHPVNAASHP
jgi:hypothetical protein